MIIHLHSSIENKFSQISYLLVKKLFFIADFSLISKYCGIDGVDGSHATCETYSPSFGLLEREAIFICFVWNDIKVEVLPSFSEIGPPSS